MCGIQLSTCAYMFIRCRKSNVSKKKEEEVENREVEKKKRKKKKKETQKRNPIVRVQFIPARRYIRLRARFISFPPKMTKIDSKTP